MTSNAAPAASSAVGRRLRALLLSPEAWACVLLAITMAVTLKINPWARDIANDFGLYRLDGHAFVHGILPYRDLFFEYPPLAAPVMMAPFAIGDGVWSYVHTFAVEMLVFGWVVVVAVGSIATSVGASKRLAVLSVGLSPLLIGAVIRSRFDLVPVALTVIAMALVLKGRPRLGLVLLGLGVVTKGFPIAALPIALAWLWAREGRRVAVASGLCCAGVVGLVMGAAFALSPHGVLQSVHFQLGRPVQIESTAASVLFVAGHLGIIAQPATVFGHREWGLVASGASAAVLAVELLGLLTVVALCTGVAHKPTPRGLVLGMAAALAAYAAFTDALSPQYMLWSLPLLAIAASARLWMIAATTATAMMLTMLEYAHFGDVLAQHRTWIAVLIVRNLLTLTSIWLAAARVSGVELAGWRLHRLTPSSASAAG